VIVVAAARRGRQTMMIDEARAFVPIPTDLAPRSVRIGQVPLMAKPARITASRKVAQPVDDVASLASVSDCLKA